MYIGCTGIHAREWISIAVATYIINQIVHHDGKDNFMEKLNFHILPIANPDGYIYTWSNPSNKDIRLWRKNRNANITTHVDTRHNEFSNLDCIGVDLNRNFDVHWNGKKKIKLIKAQINTSYLSTHQY